MEMPGDVFMWFGLVDGCEIEMRRKISRVEFDWRKCRFVGLVAFL